MTTYLSVWTGLARNPIRGKVSGDFAALWLERGRISLEGVLAADAQFALLPAGGRYRFEPAGEARWVRFELSAKADPSADASAAVELAEGELLLRLDEVKFPPGAVAYRHVHPGAGFRVLTAGALEIISDDHREVATPGHIWFEPGNSPVRAEASGSERMTSFVRFMVLPESYKGKPTIQILDPAEAALPRLQVTHRHIDQIVQLPSG